MGCQSPSSGDCEVAAERASFPESSVRNRDGSTRYRLRTPTGTGASRSTQECEWKQGESAVARKGNG
jgi:hypothetical protein